MSKPDQPKKTPRREIIEPALRTFRKRYVNDEHVEENYGISKRKLRHWRTYAGADSYDGPPFKQFGRKVCLYEVGALERWIDGLPGSGGEREETVLLRAVEMLARSSQPAATLAGAVLEMDHVGDKGWLKQFMAARRTLDAITTELQKGKVR